MEERLLEVMLSPAMIVLYIFAGIGFSVVAMKLAGIVAGMLHSIIGSHRR